MRKRTFNDNVPSPMGRVQLEQVAARLNPPEGLVEKKMLAVFIIVMAEITRAPRRRGGIIPIRKSDQSHG